jgi:uncharacterized membrane protein YuzA (DUF378 family)
MVYKMKWLKNTVSTLAFVGGLNWVTVATFKVDLVEKIVGLLPASVSWLTTPIYIVAGVSIMWIVAGKVVKKTLGIKE